MKSLLYLFGAIISLGYVTSFVFMNLRVLNRFCSSPHLPITFAKMEDDCEDEDFHVSSTIDHMKIDCKDDWKHRRGTPFPSYEKIENSNLFGLDIFETIDAKHLFKTRFVENRAYARPYQFALANATRPPTTADLEAPEQQNSEFLTGNSLVNKLAVAAFSFVAFPYIRDFISTLIGQTSLIDLGKMAEIFVPGISIVYGTFVALTLQICFDRQASLQRNVSTESSLLSLLARDLLLLFRNREQDAIDACQCVADQVRSLVRESRGSELMGLIYCDPYARIIDIVSNFELDITSPSNSNDTDQQKTSSLALISRVRDMCKEATGIRALRLSDESLSLPPTHLQVLISLTSQMLLGFIISSLAYSTSASKVEYAAVFALLCSVYVHTYKYIEDLNDPFVGTNQVRRSSTACNLLQIKMLFCSHPLTKDRVDFDDAVVQKTSTAFRMPNNDFVRSTTSGLGSQAFKINDYE